MQKFIHIFYTVLLAGIFLLVIYLSVHFKENIYQKRTDGGYKQLKEYETSWLKDEDAPQRIKSEISFTIQDVSDGNFSLIFFTKHQNVEVFINEELVYSLKPDSENLFGKTSGKSWNSIPIFHRDEGKPVRILLTPVYENTVGVIPDFYLGTQYTLYNDIIRKNIFIFFLSVVAIVLGLVFVMFSLYNYRNTETDKSLLMLGIFSVMIGTWKFADMDAVALLFPGSLLFANLPYLALLLVVVPFVLFVKELFTKKNGLVWDILCIAGLAVAGISLLLQFLHIRDLREMLWLNHLVMGALIVVVLCRMHQELQQHGWNKRLKATTGCIAACVTGVAADIGVYYISKGTTMTVLGIMGFVAYVVVLGALSLQDTKKLMAAGMQVKRLEKMAFNDQLTGLYNRAAYVDFTCNDSFNVKDCIVVMCDLNNLKKCNDTYGHEAGDRYIIQSAKEIRAVFENLGRCFRLGGDEFCILINGSTIEECKDRIQALKVSLSEYNRTHPEEFPIQIACGYKMFDKSIDYDIGDTLRRADKMMYHEKLMMKQEKIAAC